MWAVRTSLTVAALMVLSGCAFGGSRQAMTRLQSQVGLLDERVTQLERASVGGFSAAPSAGVSTDFGSTVAVAPSPRQSASASGGATNAYLKPSAKEIQQALKNAGFYQGSVDGKAGPQTKSAIKEFQRVHGLTDDGVVGRKTWAKLSSYAELSAAPGEATAGETLK